MAGSDKILIVDDHLETRQLLSISLAPLGYEITSVADGFQAMERIEAERFNVTILDLMLPGSNGIEILNHIREQGTETKVIVITAHASLETATEALRLGAYDYITKPFQVKALQSTVRRAMEKQHLETRLAAIYDLSREIALSLNVVQVAEAVLNIVERVLEFKICGLGLVDEQQNDIYCLAVRGMEREAIPRIPLNSEKGIVAAAVRSREAIYAPDVQQSPMYLELITTTRSELVVPLGIKNRVIGVLNVESAEVDAFSPDDVRLVSILAAQAAAAIENAQLYEQAQQEIAERKQAEQEIKRRRDYFRAVVNGLHDQVIIIDRDYRISDANAVFLRQMGCTREDVVGRHCYKVICQRNERCGDDEHPCPARQVWETGRPARTIRVHCNPGNEKARWRNVAASPLCDAEGQVTHVIEAHRDVTTERRLEERLAGVHALGQELVLSRSERQVTQVTADAAVFLLQSQMCGLWLVDREERALIPQAYAGRTESVNLCPLPLDDEGNLVAAVARGGEPIYVPDVQKEPRYTRLSAGLENRSALCAPLKVKDKVIGVLNAESDRPDGFDETDRRLFSVLADYSALALENAHLHEAEREQRKLVEQSQAQLVLSEKLAATGRMAASLAHEINNPLQAIHNSLQLLLSFPLEPDERREYLQMANDEVERLIGIGTRILGFARRPRQEMKPTHLNDVVEKTLTLSAKYFQHRHVTLQRDLSSDLPRILAASGELEQVFLNLVINAVEAMPDGGTLRISSYPAKSEKDGYDGHLAVTFSDTGCGITPEHLDRLFESFFSTKEDGTGLGLSVSYGVVKRHGGDITVQSVPREGTTFTVWLPAMKE